MKRTTNYSLLLQFSEGIRHHYSACLQSAVTHVHQCFRDFLQRKAPFTAVCCLVIFTIAFGNLKKLSVFNLWQKLWSPRAQSKKKQELAVGTFKRKSLPTSSQYIFLVIIFLLIFLLFKDLINIFSTFYNWLWFSWR